MNITLHIGKDRITIDGITKQDLIQLVNCLTTTVEGRHPSMELLCTKLTEVVDYINNLDQTYVV